MTRYSQPPTAERYPPKAELEAAFNLVRKARVPQIPDVVLGLREVLSRREPNVKVAADLIAQDLAMTGQVLKTINSPLFACRANISSVKQAVTLMGIDRLANLVTAEAINRMLGATRGPARVVWDAIMEQARATVAISRMIEDMSSDDAYLFGIMHDVGSLIFVDLLEDYGSEWVLRGASPQALLQYEWASMGVDHTTVGFLLAGTWRLPESLALAIYHHHDPGCADVDDSKVRTLVAMAKLAHYLIALPLGTHEMPEMLAYRDAARRELSISEDDWSTLCEEAVDVGWSH